MTEDELEREVRRLIAEYRLLGYHNGDSRRSQPGFPDWVIVGRYGVLWRELKSSTGRMKPKQFDWAYALRAAGQDFAVWDPADLQADRIAQELHAIAA